MRKTFKQIKDPFGQLIDTIGDENDHLNFWNDEFDRDKELANPFKQQKIRSEINNFYNDFQESADRERKRMSVLDSLQIKAQAKEQQGNQMLDSSIEQTRDGDANDLNDVIYFDCDGDTVIKQDYDNATPEQKSNIRSKCTPIRWKDMPKPKGHFA